MLKTLHVQNFGIFDDVEVDFPSGLVCLTGETGAGKSLLVDALKLLLGSRSDPSDVRHGKETALVEAVFIFAERGGSRQAFEDAGYDFTDGELRLRRSVSSSGRSRAWIQGKLSTARELSELGGRMVSIAGQHAFMGLGVPGERLAMLDAYAGLDGPVDDFSRLYQEFLQLDRYLSSLEEKKSESASRREHLEYVIREIEEVGLQPDEFERLSAEAMVLRESGRLRDLAVSADNDLYEGGESAFDRLGKALEAMREAGGVDDSLADLVKRIESIRIETREAARDLADYVARIDADPGRLDGIESRLDKIRGLSSRHGGSVESTLETLESSRAELAEISGEALDMSRVRKERDESEKNLLDAAKSLSRRREKAASSLSKSVTEVLVGLAMQGANLDARLSDTEPGRTGTDRLAFLVQTNPGEGSGPVEDIASGGELSRIALSLFSVMSSAVGTPVMVFDEIDVGVSGSVADRMADVLRKAAGERQVLVVTHHGPVAARADAHFLVEKRSTGNRTVAGLSKVSGEDRLREIARMVGGRDITQKVTDHARELLERQQQLL